MIQKASNIHISIIYNISNQCFGYNYITACDIELYIKNDIVIISVLNNIITGFCIILKSNIPVIKTLCINTDFQKQGIGKLLLDKAIANCASFTTIHYYAWKERIPEYFINTLNKKGFKLLETQPEYWKYDSIKRGYSCIKCGFPCLCTLDIYELKID